MIIEKIDAANRFVKRNKNKILVTTLVATAGLASFEHLRVIQQKEEIAKLLLVVEIYRLLEEHSQEIHGL